jgi:hypothetical protein
MENEIWKDVPKFEGIYQVSNLGRVKSLKRKARNTIYGSFRPINEKILSQKKEKSGYMAVNLCIKRKGKYRRVHTLVLEAFVGIRQDKMCCCHNDGNRQNNKLSNLRYDTYKGNAKDRIRHGTVPHLNHKCENHPRARFKNIDVIMMRKLLKEGVPRYEIEKMYNVGHGKLSNIFAGNQWKDIL